MGSISIHDYEKLKNEKCEFYIFIFYEEYPASYSFDFILLCKEGKSDL